MIIKNITISKSRTIGIMTPDGRTKFSKVQITASGELEEGQDRVDGYKEVSLFIEAQFEFEKGLNQ